MTKRILMIAIFFFLPLRLILALSPNEITLRSYGVAVEEYVQGTPEEVSGSFKDWLDTTLEHLKPNARIIEIGSAFGRDAKYIESRGFAVERTDATEEFVALLQKEGYSARKFNLLSDPFLASYDVVFANAVFLHFTPGELEVALHKIKQNLNEEGILSFSLKKGEGEEWTQAKLGHPRYFRYWQLSEIQLLLQSVGFQILSLTDDDRFLQIIAKKP